MRYCTKKTNKKFYHQTVRIKEERSMYAAFLQFTQYAQFRFWLCLFIFLFHGYSSSFDILIFLYGVEQL